jgi:single-strand DNA-binding protein
MLNKVLLIGHLGQPPQIKRTQGGTRYALLSLATSRRRRDKTTGEARQHTEWHRVVVWTEGLVGLVEAHLAKGAKLWIEGSLGSRRWTDADGIERVITEVVLQDFDHRLVMLDRKPGAAPDPEDEDGYGAEAEAFA